MTTTRVVDDLRRLAQSQPWLAAKWIADAIRWSTPPSSEAQGLTRSTAFFNAVITFMITYLHLHRDRLDVTPSPTSRVAAGDLVATVQVVLFTDG